MSGSSTTKAALPAAPRTRGSAADHRPGDARYQRVAEHFRLVFRRIAADSLDRERAETLAHEQLGWLTEAGFARLRTPSILGGFGVRLSDLFLLLTELAEVDVNLAHVWRNHYSFVEDRLHALDDPQSAVWLERLGRGEIVGGGWSEGGTGTQTTVETTIVQDPDGWLVTGTKAYSTGSVYADWFTVLARSEDGTKVVALVSAHQPGVTVGDDWDGFGQRLTGSGTVTYRGARVAPHDAIPYATRYSYQAHYYQTVLHCLLVGIGRAIVHDGVAALAARRRSHDNALVSDPTADPELLEVIGRVSAQVFAAESALLRSLDLIDRYVEAEEAGSGTTSSASEERQEAWLAVAQAQTVVTDGVLGAATAVFDALGASGTSGSLALDRHWRNARTLASHNPRVYVQRLVGDFLVNGASPFD